MFVTWLKKLSCQFRNGKYGVNLTFTTLRQLLTPYSRNENEARREYIFNVIALTLSVITGIMLLTATYLQLTNPNRNGVTLLTIGLVHGSFCGLFVLGKTKYRKIARQLLLLILVSPCLYALKRWGLLLVTPLLGCTLVIIMAGILHNRLTALFYTSAIICYLAFLQWQTQHGHTPDVSWLQTPVQPTYWVELSVIFIAILIVTSLAEKEIISGQYRANQAEEALRQERDQLEIRLRDRTEQLIKLHTEQTATLLKLAQYGQEFAGYFHDLVNPITAASVTLEEIAHQNQKKSNPLIQKAEKAMEHALTFIRSIQKQLQSGAPATNVQISDSVNQATEMIKSKLNRHAITLTVAPLPTTQFYTDSIKLFQIITNLLNNAIDACKDNPPHKPRHIWLTITTQSAALLLTIRDTGSGIPESIQSRIFEPLTTTKSAETGLGLGLSIVHHIVTKEYGGTIAVTQTNPSGTTFELYVPPARPPTT